jgi:hypothetical protein
MRQPVLFSDASKGNVSLDVLGTPSETLRFEDRGASAAHHVNRYRFSPRHSNSEGDPHKDQAETGARTLTSTA